MKRLFAIDKDQWGSLFSWLPVVLLVVSLSYNFVLIQRSQRKPAPQVSVGTDVADMVAKDLEGNTTTIRLSSRSTMPTILYVFSPTCTWCKANLPNLNALASAQGKAFRLIGLSLRAEGVADYISKNNITFPVYVEPQAEFIKDLKLGATPETLVVGRNGKIEKVWMGAYASAAQQEVEKVFGVSLPGMVMPSAASNMASSPSEE